MEFEIYNIKSFFLILVITIVLASCQDSFKKDAICFLEDRKNGVKVVKKTIVGNDGNEIVFIPYNYESLYEAKDSLSELMQYNTLFFQPIYDNEAVSSKFLKKHVDLMFQRRKESAFLKQLEFNKFHEYVLPYRSGKEIFVDYHQELEIIFSNYINNLPQSASINDKAVGINNRLKDLVEFDLRSHALLYEPSILEVLKDGRGSCNSLTALTAQAMRYFGIPTAIDECPVWAHRNSGHRWNAFLSENGKWIPFGGAETNPDEFDVITDSVKVPKIYRHTFSAQKGFQPPCVAINMPVVFQESNRVDVTKDYVSTCDVKVDVSNSNKNNSILYLAVFNAERWEVVSWAELKKGNAIFENIGNNNIVYLPCYYKNMKVIPAAAPFILRRGGREVIRGDYDKERVVELDIYNNFFDFQWNIGKVKQGHKMELFYWDNEWISCGTCVAGNKEKLVFENVPENALYWLKSYDWENTWQRIFTIENGNQVWY